MDFGWSEEQLAFRAAVVDFARRALADDVPAREKRGEFARGLWRRCGEFGIQGLPFPEEYGGGGQDILTTILAMEALGYGCPDNGLHFGLAAQMWSVQMPIWRHGTEEQKRAYLPRLCSGEWVGAHAMSEPDSALDAFALRTCVAEKRAALRADGHQDVRRQAPVADLFVVFATLDRERPSASPPSCWR